METIIKHVNIPTDRHLVMDLQLPVTISDGVSDVVLVFQTHVTRHKKNVRKLGMFKWAIRTSDDFDEPLGDDFWLGAEREIPS